MTTREEKEAKLTELRQAYSIAKFNLYTATYGRGHGQEDLDEWRGEVNKLRADIAALDQELNGNSFEKGLVNLAIALSEERHYNDHLDLNGE